VAETQNITNSLMYHQSEKDLQSLVNWWCDSGFDKENNRFYSEVSNENMPRLNANYTVIQRTRLLWFFSALSQMEDYVNYRKYADIQFEELLSYFYDQEYKGFIWEVDKEYKPTIYRKQSYAQAFAIYALSEYYILTKNKKAKDIANETFSLLENKIWEQRSGGYTEAVDRQWNALDDLRLSDKDMNEPKTMNTHLHILEAYTNLAIVDDSQMVTDSLERITQLYIDKFFNNDSNHFELFYDNDWNLKSDIISYGHDIESAWLLLKASKYINNSELNKSIEAVADKIAISTKEEGVDVSGGIKNESHNGVQDLSFDWWPQAEGVVGFLYAYDLTGKVEYMKIAKGIYQFITENIVDDKYGEWYWNINTNMQPEIDRQKSNAWKAPYHNGRMYLEILKRGL